MNTREYVKSLKCIISFLKHGASVLKDNVCIFFEFIHHELSCP